MEEESKDTARGKNIVVTGAAGFLGTNLVRRLIAEDGNRVIGVDNLFSGRRENIVGVSLQLSDMQSSNVPQGDFRFLEADINNDDFLEVVKAMFGSEPVHEVYHLACPASPPKYQSDPWFTLNTCIIGTRNVMNLAMAHGARVLFSSTSECYGDPLEHPQKESYRGNVNTMGPRSCYDEGKRAAETVCYLAKEREGVDARVVRIFNTYGPFMDPEDGRVVSTLINQALDGEDMTLFGDGSQTRSFCYVDDLIEGIVRYMNLGERFLGPINLGNPSEFTMWELADVVRKAVPGYEGVIEYRDLPKDDPTRRKPDISRAYEKLGWRPEIELREGIEKTVKYFALMKGQNVGAGDLRAGFGEGR